MRPFLLFVFLVITNGAISQVFYEKIKCDSFQYTIDSSKVMLYKKDKTSVIDRARKKNQLKPTKFPLFYLAEEDLFIEFSEERINLIYLQGDKRKVNLYTKNGTKVEAKFPNQKGGMLDSLIFFNGANINYKGGEDLENVDSTVFENGTTLELEKLNNNLLLVNYAKLPVLSYGYFEELGLQDSGFAKSGVYDLENRKWVIPPVYFSCNQVGDNFICAKIDTLKSFTWPGDDLKRLHMTFSFDQYEIKNGMATLVKGDVITPDQFDLERLFNATAVETVSEITTFSRGQHFLVDKNGKKSLVYLKIIKPWDHNVNFPEVGYHELLPPVYDFILFESDLDEILTYQKNAEESFTAFVRIDNEKVIKKASSKEFIKLKYEILNENEVKLETIYLNGKIQDSIRENWTFTVVNRMKPISEIRHDKISYRDQVLGLEFSNDSLLIVTNTKSDWLDPYTEPLKSILYPEEDSIIYDAELGFGCATYPDAIHGFNKSGVYNLVNKNWYINPVYLGCQSNSLGYFLTSYNRNTNEYIWHSFKSNNADMLFEDVSVDDISNNPELLQFLYGTYDTVVDLPSKVGVNPVNEWDKNYKMIYQLGRGWSVVLPNPSEYDVDPEPISKPKEFVYYSETYDTFFWLENDSIYTEIENKTYAVSQSEGEIIVWQHWNFDPEITGTEIILITGKDSTEIKFGTIDESNLLKDSPFRLSIKIDGQDLIINDQGFYSEIQEYYDKMEYLHAYIDKNNFVEFEHEASSIWRKENGIWQKQTPYYQSVEKIPFGYIVTTGGSLNISIVDDSEERTATFGNAVILDQNLEAISYLDYFVFESAYVCEFGIIVQTNKGKFLIDETGKQVTTDDWDEFELENGKIKAIKYKEFDDFDLWEMELEDLIEEIKYFEWTDH